MARQIHETRGEQIRDSATPRGIFRHTVVNLKLVWKLELGSRFRRPQNAKVGCGLDEVEQATQNKEVWRKSWRHSDSRYPRLNKSREPSIRKLRDRPCTYGLRPLHCCHSMSNVNVIFPYGRRERGESLISQIATSQLQSASIARSQGLLECFCWSSPGRWAIVQLLCSQTRRKLPKKLAEKLSSKPCNPAINTLCTLTYNSNSPHPTSERLLREIHPCQCRASTSSAARTPSRSWSRGRRCWLRRVRGAPPSRGSSSFSGSPPASSGSLPYSPR